MSRAIREAQVNAQNLVTSAQDIGRLVLKLQGHINNSAERIRELEYIESAANTIKHNVDNDKLSDADFRRFVGNTLGTIK